MACMARKAGVVVSKAPGLPHSACEAGGGGATYRMLDPISAYAARLLIESGETVVLTGDAIKFASRNLGDKVAAREAATECRRWAQRPA